MKMISAMNGSCAGWSYPLITLEPPRSMVDDWRAPLEEEVFLRLRLHPCTGRPLGSVTFIRRLKEQTYLILLPLKRGPKPKRQAEEAGDGWLTTIRYGVPEIPPKSLEA